MAPTTAPKKKESVRKSTSTPVNGSTTRASATVKKGPSTKKSSAAPAKKKTANGSSSSKSNNKKKPASTTATKATKATKTTTTTTTTPSPNNHHRLDKFGFIINMDSQGKIHPSTNFHDTHSQDSQDEASFEMNDDPHKIPTYQEYHRTQRREKKWGVMMDRWVVPAQKMVQAKAQSLATAGTNAAAAAVGMPRSPPRIKATPPTPQEQHHHNVQTKRAGFAHRRKVVTRLRKGVPDHLRGPAWEWLARVPHKMKQHPGLYHKLVQQSIAQHEQATDLLLYQEAHDGTLPPADTFPKIKGVPYLGEHAKSFKNIQDTIERDIHRTYPRHHLFYESDRDSDDEIAAATAAAAAALESSSSREDLDDQSEHKGNDSDAAAARISPPPALSLLSRNPSLRRSHSPTEVNHSARPPLTMMGSLEDEEDDDAASAVRLQETNAAVVTTASSSGFCGNDEISEMIRELEGVVGVGDGGVMSPTSLDHPSVASKAAAPSRLPSSGGGGRDMLPEHVADAVGGQASLRRVLKAYSVYDREVGYCQGMNFVAGMFLTLVGEEEAFWLLVSVMNEQPCRMRGLFGEGMKETHLVLYVAEKLIQQFLPKLYKHLEREHVHITMFATQWLLTQYTSSFKFDLVTRVWDSFLGEGWKVTYRVMLAILKINEPTLLQSSFEDILALFRELPDNTQGSSVMKVAMDIPLKRSHIRKYETEWNRQEERQMQQQAAAVSAAVVNSSTTQSKKKTKQKKKGTTKPSPGRVR